VHLNIFAMHHSLFLLDIIFYCVAHDIVQFIYYIICIIFHVVIPCALSSHIGSFLMHLSMFMSGMYKQKAKFNALIWFSFNCMLACLDMTPSGVMHFNWHHGIDPLVPSSDLPCVFLLVLTLLKVESFLESLIIGLVVCVNDVDICLLLILMIGIHFLS
ncbi:hypothetical protein ACJX0J_006571, partial [Zea mays]